MASGLAVAVTKGVVGKLGELVVQQVLNEVSLLRNFGDDFKWLQKKFNYISGALQHADNQNVHNVPVKQWLAEVRDIAFDAEDITDECSVEHLYTNTSQVCVCSYSQLSFNRKMGKRIKTLKDRVSSVIQDGEHLKLLHDLPRLDQPSSSSASGRGTQFRRGSAILEVDPQAVGVEEKAEEILRLLEQPAVGVVAVVGMGGLGKTFLLQHVYNRNKQRYEHSAWISVSQTCSLRTLQCDLAKQINLQIEGSISEVLVADLIHGHLDGKRCLIVLDDVWRSSVEGDIIQRLGLPTGSNSQCKIVVTTRSREVAANVRAQIYEMQQLSKEDSWKLFCLFAFRDREENRPPKDLESLTHQIVEKCGSLPLAIKTVAASMTNFVSLWDWESKLKQLKDAIGAEDYMMQILKLSYDSLPSHLKSCFAYFSFFPKDTKIDFITNADTQSIHQDYLIYLWIAEGYIPQENEQEQCDTGLNYLHQLVNLCLVEVNTVCLGYTVHDLLHDLAINVSKEHKCQFHLLLQETSCRRLLLGKKGITNDAISDRSLHRQQFLRTLSVFENPDITRIPEHLFDRLRLLRVLDLSNTAISALPKCVGKLKLLKVLNLSQTKITELPDCLRRLKSLQFLDVCGCTALQCVPNWINELKSLSHLDVRDCSEELPSHMPKGISALSNLITLRSHDILLCYEDNDFLNVKDIGNLINLREISFYLEDVDGLRSVEDGILERLVKMRNLGVGNNITPSEDDFLPAFPETINVMKDLEHLGLSRFSVPSWICGMVNLTTLELYECSNYPSLQNMPNLQSLLLKNDSRCTELPNSFGECGGFPQLVRLYIFDFPLLEELPTLQEGAMERLEGLWICNCPQVKKVPEGLEPLRRLKLIQVEDASAELEERLKEGGKDWNKIKANNLHIDIEVY
ncbi:hypothetical protein SUGI_0076260 [Cryptomeria japonica]|uniref:putative disease resistance protein RGA3 n=1 Tax=Cryptomeria japonica TaxID=3369 RepID=UPI002408A5C7|nr:putative disease resistance protein RGA3 [Cryptomeria japonica]GLJ07894.1 hypothetical protein SUGI_0076260 [Cryptomeria japonica]